MGEIQGPDIGVAQGHLEESDVSFLVQVSIFDAFKTSLTHEPLGGA